MCIADRLDEAAVYTTCGGEPFTFRQCAQLAYLIYVRFGRSLGAACLAWERMLQNTTDLSDFRELVESGMKEDTDDQTT